MLPFGSASTLPTEEVGRRGDRSEPPATGTPAQNREVPTDRGSPSPRGTGMEAEAWW